MGEGNDNEKWVEERLEIISEFIVALYMNVNSSQWVEIGACSLHSGCIVAL